MTQSWRTQHSVEPRFAQQIIRLTVLFFVEDPGRRQVMDRNPDITDSGFKGDLSEFMDFVSVGSMPVERLSVVSATTKSLLNPCSQSRFSKAVRLFPAGQLLVDRVDLETVRAAEISDLMEKLVAVQGSISWPRPATLSATGAVPAFLQQDAASIVEARCRWEALLPRVAKNDRFAAQNRSLLDDVKAAFNEVQVAFTDARKHYLQSKVDEVMQQNADLLNKITEKVGVAAFTSVLPALDDWDPAAAGVNLRLPT